MTGRFAESEDPVLFANYGEVDKCEFIKVNAPVDAWEAWSSTDDGAGLLVKADVLREQAREVLVSAARFSLLTPAARHMSPHLLLPFCAPHSPSSGAKGAPCGEEGACGGERGDAGELPPLSLPQPPALTTIAYS